MKNIKGLEELTGALFPALAAAGQVMESIKEQSTEEEVEFLNTYEKLLREEKTDEAEALKKEFIKEHGSRDNTNE